MRAALRKRLGGRSRDGGFTLVELLVASTIGVVVLGAIVSLVVSTMRAQPQISQRAEDISTARWVLERLTREVRNGIQVDKATASSVSFETYVRRTTCGGSTVPSPSAPAIKCEVTYTCSAVTRACTRIEAAPGVFTGTPRTIFEGIGSAQVFDYVPSAADATFIEITLHLPNPAGHAPLTVTDGASLRNATLLY